MKKTIALLTVLLFTVCAFAQDNSDIAIALFQKAENAYNIADYETALSSLKRAEQTLGSTNTKILYLKIKTLDMLAKVDGNSATDLQLTLSTFFKLADKNTYPQYKYSEMVIIKVDLMQKLQEEEDAYLKAKNSKIVSDYNAFFSQYPTSRYVQELKNSSQYQEFVKPELEKVNSNKRKEDWLRINGPVWGDLKRHDWGPPQRIKFRAIEEEAAKMGISLEDLKKFKDKNYKY